MKPITVRPIEPSDNAIVANIIRTCLVEFNAAKPGTVYFDESTDHLFELFQSTNKSIYFVAVQEGKVIGGAGIFPTANLPTEVCELVKIYLTKESRGLGLGRLMIQKCLDAAHAMGFTKVYLETMPELSNAVKTYETLGFQYLTAPMGYSGHSACSIFMLKTI